MDKASIRRLRILSYLAASRRPKSRREIADYFNVSAKTIGRDAADLVSSGFGLIVEHDRAGRTLYRFDPERGLPLGIGCPACLAKEARR